MRNLAAKFGKIFDICKKFSKNLVDERGNMPRRGVVPRFSDLEVIALSLTAEQFGVDSESYLFSLLKEYKSDFTNLISRRELNELLTNKDRYLYSIAVKSRYNYEYSFKTRIDGDDLVIEVLDLESSDSDW